MYQRTDRNGYFSLKSSIFVLLLIVGLFKCSMIIISDDLASKNDDKHLHSHPAMPMVSILNQLAKLLPPWMECIEAYLSPASIIPSTASIFKRNQKLIVLSRSAHPFSPCSSMPNFMIFFIKDS